MHARLVFFLLLALAYRSTCFAASENENGNTVHPQREQDLLRILAQSCQREAEPRLKDPEIVSNFCSFVPHLAVQHDAVLHELAGKGNAEDKMTVGNVEVLTNAMQELVRWRLQSFVEDEHVVGEKFVELARKWAVFDEGHDEL